MAEVDSDDRLPIRQVLDSLEEVFFVFTTGGKMLQWNRRVREVTGYTDEEIAAMDPADFAPPEDRWRIARKLLTVLREGQARLTTHFITKDGRHIPYEFTGSLLQHGDRQLICGTGRDITERREAEKKLRAANEALSWQIDRIERQDAFVRLMEEVARTSNQTESFEEALKKAVDAVCERVGWPVGHVYRLAEDQFHILVPTGLWNDTIDDRFAAFQEVTEETSFARGEGLPGRVLQSGDPAWISDVTEDPNFPRAELAQDIGVKGSFGFPVPVGGEVIAVLEFFSEEAQVPDDELLEVMGSVGVQLGRVAERQKAREQLEASEIRYRTLTETAVDGIVLANNQGNIAGWNQGAEKIFGYREEEALGESIEVLMPERYRPRHREGMERVRRTGEGKYLGRTLELEGLRKNGEEFPVEISLSSWAVQGTRQFAAILRDITGRKEMEREILRIREEERQRIGQELHDGIASQLTGTAMIGETLVKNMAEGQEIAPEQWEEVIELIREAGEQTRRLSRGLNPVEVGGEGLPDALERLASTGQKQSGASCSTHIEGQFGQLNEQTATHLYRIAQEGVSNAIKHAQADHIWIELTAANGELTLSVRDDGQGLPDLPKETEGVGLRTMRYRADLIGGRLEISGRSGGGTNVSCYLQLSK